VASQAPLQPEVRSDIVPAKYAPGSPRAVPPMIPSLDGMRGIVTLVVLYDHVYFSIFRMFPKSATAAINEHSPLLVGTEAGLPLYFVISGFVMFLPAVRTGTLGSMSWYALRRVVRIGPGYWLSIILLLVIWPFVIKEAISPMATTFGIGSVFAHMVFIQKMLFDSPDLGFGLNGSLWTLTIEESFYFTLPLITKVYLRRPLIGVSIALAITLAWKWGSLHLRTVLDFLREPTPVPGWFPRHFLNQYPSYIFQFALGMTAAWVYVRLYAKATPRWKYIALAVHVVAVLGITLGMDLAGEPRMDIGYMDYLATMTPAFFFAFLVPAVIFGPTWAQWPYANRLMRWTGDISLGVYLYHMIILQVVYRLAHMQERPAVEALRTLTYVVFFGSLLAGWLSFRFVERPIAMFMRNEWKKRRPLTVELPAPAPPALLEVNRDSATSTASTPVASASAAKPSAPRIPMSRARLSVIVLASCLLGVLLCRVFWPVSGSSSRSIPLVVRLGDGWFPLSPAADRADGLPPDLPTDFRWIGTTADLAVDSSRSQKVLLQFYAASLGVDRELIVMQDDRGIAKVAVPAGRAVPIDVPIRPGQSEAHLKLMVSPPAQPPSQKPGEDNRPLSLQIFAMRLTAAP
jgi:peptidoglycan/LPS O-acetylase OafA/YrhL